MSKSRESVRTFLGQSLVFGALDDRALGDLAASAVVRHRKPGAVLWRWGERVDELGMVLSGSLEISRPVEGRQRSLLRTLGPGDLVGYSTVAGEAHSADVRAKSAVSVAVIPGSVVRDLLRRRPELALSTIAELGNLVATLTDELAEARFQGLQHRVWRALRRLADSDGSVHMTHAELSGHVGASRANVSRALKRLEDAGQVRLGRGVVELLD